MKTVYAKTVNGVETKCDSYFSSSSFWGLLLYYLVDFQADQKAFVLS